MYQNLYFCDRKNSITLIIHYFSSVSKENLLPLLHKAASCRNQIGLPPWRTIEKTSSKNKFLQCNSIKHFFSALDKVHELRKEGEEIRQALLME